MPFQIRINDLEKGRRWQEVTKLAAGNKVFKVTETKSNCKELQKHLMC